MADVIAAPRMMVADVTVAWFARQFAALGAPARLRIMVLLLSSHPEGMVVGKIHQQTAISRATLSHHLERLRSVGLVTAARETRFVRYRVNTTAVERLLGAVAAFQDP